MRRLAKNETGANQLRPLCASNASYWPIGGVGYIGAQFAANETQPNRGTQTCRYRTDTNRATCSPLVELCRCLPVAASSHRDVDREAVVVANNDGAGHATWWST